MKTKIIQLFAIVLLLTSCNDDVCERGEGRMENQSFQMDVFNKVNISTPSDVEIIKSDQHRVEIKAQANILERFRVNASGETLMIAADCFNSKSRSRIKIYCQSLEKVRFSGTGKVESSSTFVSENLEIELTGAGDIELKGESQNLSVKVSGVGNVNLEGWETKLCSLKISGVSDCEVNVTEKLNVEITGKGNVYYKGAPLIEKNITGVGKVARTNS